VENDQKGQKPNGKPQAYDWRRHNNLWAIIIVLILILAIGIYAAKHTEKKKETPPYMTYKSQRYNFKFTYPTVWGAPKVDALQYGGGKRYTITFNPSGYNSYSKKSVAKPDQLTTIRVVMDSSKVCEGQEDCSSLTKKVIQDNLATPTQPFVGKDTGSYGMVITAPQVGIQSRATISQIVNLPKLSVDAASGTYEIDGQAQYCTSASLVNKDGCVKPADYNRLAQLLKSITAI